MSQLVIQNSLGVWGWDGQEDVIYFLKGMIKSNDPDQMQQNLVPDKMKQNLIPDIIIKIQCNLVLDDMQWSLIRDKKNIGEQISGPKLFLSIMLQRGCQKIRLLKSPKKTFVFTGWCWRMQAKIFRSRLTTAGRNYYKMANQNILNMWKTLRKIRDELL